MWEQQGSLVATTTAGDPWGQQSRTGWCQLPGHPATGRAKATLAMSLVPAMSLSCLCVSAACPHPHMTTRSVAPWDGTTTRRCTSSSTGNGAGHAATFPWHHRVTSTTEGTQGPC